MDSGRLIFDPSCHGNMLFLGNADPILRGSRSVLNMEESSRRRPFFTSPEELFDDEYYDEQTPEKKRRLSPEQVHMLEKSFEADNKLEPERKSDLAKKLGLQQRQVAVWFQNRRARWKTKQLERDYDQLKSSYDSLLSDYDSILKDNQKLKAEVLSLAEKVNAKEMTEPPLLGKKSDSLVVDTEQADTEQVPSLQSIVKVEDRLSTGSGRSIVVDEDGPHLVDSGDSYFPENEYPGCVSPMDVVHSSEDDGTDNTHNYFPDVFVAAQQENHHAEDEEPTGWWVWA